MLKTVIQISQNICHGHIYGDYFKILEELDKNIFVHSI